jgi:hypothetical protein
MRWTARKAFEGLGRAVDRRSGLAYAVVAMGVRAHQRGTTMKNLAAVLVLLAVVGVGRAGEKEIVERLKKAGAKICYFGRLVAEGGNIRYVGETDNLMVFLDSQSVDAGLSDLCELRRLRVVVLSHPGLTEAQMWTLCDLEWLSSLYLDRCPVTDAHLKQVLKLRKLKGLGLTDTRVTDAGLEELTALRDLARLYLDGTAITDAGLRHLERLGRLTVLDLGRCPNITDEGVARLQKALPKCTICR